jgi:hypothetical protein
LLLTEVIRDPEDRRGRRGKRWKNNTTNEQEERGRRIGSARERRTSIVYEDRRDINTDA